MPNRYTREAAIKSEAVNSLSWHAEVFYRRLINLADDFGRYTAHLALLRAAAFPLQLEKVSETDVGKLLKECESAGLLFAYTGPDEKAYFVMNKWEKGRAKESDYPSPPDDVCERMQTFVYRRKQKSAYAPDSDSDSDSDADTNSDADKAAGAASASKAPQDDETWLNDLQQNPTYHDIDVRREYGKMLTWCQTNHKQPSRKRFTNWINRCERPMSASKSKPTDYSQF